MPMGVFRTVREVSSEDASNVAANLLQGDAAKKWKTKAKGERSAYVVLEFEEPQQIVGIDIGNEHAGFIEVLVSKSGCQPDDFIELILSSSFMTPIESKNSTNVNRVRCFNVDALNTATLADKWKLVKIVCTQPFNRHVQYGLSFIKAHVVGNKAVKPTSLVPDKPKPTSTAGLAAFKLREDSTDSEPDGKASLSLFQRWKASRNDKPMKPAVSTASAIRDAASPSALRRLSDTRPVSINKVEVAAATSTTTSSSSSSSSSSSDKAQLDRNRDSLLFGDDDPDEEDANLDGAKKQRLSKHIEADKTRRRLELEKELELKKQKSKRQSIDKTTTTPTATAVKRMPIDKTTTPTAGKRMPIDKTPTVAAVKESPKEPAQKRVSSSPEVVSKPAKKPKVIVQKSIKYAPFNQLLNGVVLVISGIQNPDRAELRSKALALGAKYKADWGTGCTHLICAFRNTPKYNQVRRKGKIVTRSWIEKCYELKKYLPWRRYALNDPDLGNPESDEEVLDESMKPKEEHDADKDVEMAAADSPPQTVKSFEGMTQQGHSSGPDTEDELERVAEKNKLKKTSDKNQRGKDSNEKKEKNESESLDVYEATTDEEDYLKQKRNELQLK